MKKSCLKTTKNIRFRLAEFTASALRFRTMCTATLGDGNDVNMVIRSKTVVVLLGAMKVDTSTFGCRFLSAASSRLRKEIAQNHVHFFGNQNEIFLFTAAQIIIFKNSTQCCVIAAVYLVIQR